MNTLFLCKVIFLLVEVSMVFGVLSSPENLDLQTLNTRYILRWEWDPKMAVNETVTFTAQYLAQYKSRKPAHKQVWKSVCVDVVEPHCDFSDAGLFYFGMYLLRVQANTSQQSSPWVQIEFCPDKHAAIGPPSSVMLNSAKDVLEIIISDPLDNTNKSMKELSQKMYYIIQYWKKYEDTQKAKILHTTNNVVTLSELDKKTWYCVRVQSRCDFYNKTSVFTDTHCNQTAGETTSLQIFLYFLSSLGLFFLLVLILSFGTFKAYKTIKSIFYPTLQLPLYIQEHWEADSDMPWLLIPESETICEKLEVTSVEKNAAVTVMESHISDQDQGTETHSRHDSKDSGFNSTEEDSSHRQYGLTQHASHNGVQMEDVCETKHREEKHDGMQEFCI